MVGFNTTFGLIDLPFSGSGYSSAFKLFAYAQPVVSIIGYDATLQGGIFTNDNPYEIFKRYRKSYLTNRLRPNIKIQKTLFRI